MKLRIQFTKHGSMKFIGHLDTMRYFQKAIRRSGIDISYTGGFSPHQIMTFAHPLGVGVESESEIMDIEVNSYDLIGYAAGSTISGGSDRARLISALAGQMSEGFSIRDIRLLPDDAKNAMSSVAAASYDIRLRDETSIPGVERAIDDIMASEHVNVIKKTKKNESEIDIRPGIYELGKKDRAIYMTVDASSAGNIKPAIVMSTIAEKAGADPQNIKFAVTRTEIYGRDTEGVLLPLIDFGSEF